MRSFGLLVLLLAGLWSGGAWGQTCTASALPAAFGVYLPSSSSAVTTTGTVTVSCQVILVAIGVSYTIKLGIGGGTGFGARSMGPASPRLGYQLYTDSALSQVWGDGTAGTFTVTDGYLLALGGPVVRNYTVYGKIPGSQNVATGGYTDTVSVLVSY